MDQIAEKYVKLALAVGEHDPLYVDAYYGPPEWKPETKPLAQIRSEAESLRSQVSDDSARGRYLSKQLDSMIARVRMLGGEKLPFDEESKALYDVVDPGRPDSYYLEILSELEGRLPGQGSLSERYDKYREQFTIPRDSLGPVFATAIEEARAETLKYIQLPADESFEIEYVSGEVWSAYNWFKGGSHSLIQVNTDFPMTIDRALDLALHEGYPGHHVYNALLEKHLAKGKGWVEFTVYALYSPQSLIAEGTAEYGRELTFTPENRLRFEREILYPLAGLDSSAAGEFAEIRSLVDRLGYAPNDAARRLLDGEVTREETVAWFSKHALATPARAEQRVRFIEAHRSYVVTYNLGLDLVRAYMDRQPLADRWDVFRRILSTPIVPSDLA